MYVVPLALMLGIPGLLLLFAAVRVMPAPSLPMEAKS
jgi:hypothetical protein